jgi:hypothetical protein
MSLSEAAIAIGLLTPLILGLLAFLEKLLNRKNKEDKSEETQVVQGMPIAFDYTSEYIEEIKKDRDQAIRERDVAYALLREKDENIHRLRLEGKQ